MGRRNLSVFHFPFGYAVEAIQSRLEELNGVLHTDVDKARQTLRKFLGTVVLQPTSQSCCRTPRNIEVMISRTLSIVVPGASFLHCCNR